MDVTGQIGELESRARQVHTSQLQATPRAASLDVQLSASQRPYA